MDKIRQNYLIGILVLSMSTLGIISGLWLSGLFDYEKYDGKTFQKLQYDGSNVLVLKPRFTEAAYSENGFYSYYSGKCSTCNSIPLNTGSDHMWVGYNKKMVKELQNLGYPMMDDTSIDQILKSTPYFLDRYDTIILLHNEYVTQSLFDAITTHQNVIYLYPNALYAEIEYKNNTMTLVRGHGYPDESVDNGFDWEYDNTHPYEFDTKCDNWAFKRISNGYQLNCTPELSFYQKPEILNILKTLL